MHTLDLRRDPAIDARTRAALVNARADVAARCPQLAPPATVRWSARPVAGLDRATPWLWGPADRDPLLGPGGPAVIPLPQLRELRRIVAAGARFDAVGVAHELDPDGPVRPLLPLLADGPRTCSDEVARELVGPVPARPGATRLLDGLVGGAAAGRLAGALDQILDPIVFGVVAPWPLTDGVPSLWFPLVVWRW